MGLNYYDVLDTHLDTQDIMITGSGYGVGWNIAMMQHKGALSFGLSYHSPVEADIKGTFDWPGVIVVPSTSSIEFPSMLQLGIRYEFLSDWAIELDFERTGWKSFDKIVITNANNGSVLTTSTSNWEDSNAYRLNVNYRINNNTLLRVGYAYDESPVKGKALFSARAPGADRQSISVGLGIEFDTWIIDIGYLYVLIDDRDVNSSTAFSGGEPNGTSVYNGRYMADSQVLGLGIQVKF